MGFVLTFGCSGNLDIIKRFDVKKILVVNGFREKGRKAVGWGFEAFSLEEEGIKKTDEECWRV